jgi:hypothetical protein
MTCSQPKGVREKLARLVILVFRKERL